GCRSRRNQTRELGDIGWVIARQIRIREWCAVGIGHLGWLVATDQSDIGMLACLVGHESPQYTIPLAVSMCPTRTRMSIAQRLPIGLARFQKYRSCVNALPFSL